ncbi:MAG TPA: tetratricopeptide repeat protein [Acidisarcina sp.]|nr:tetratricopeptide repeat protein [Acidisarcina sp.]
MAYLSKSVVGLTPLRALRFTISFFSIATCFSCSVIGTVRAQTSSHTHTSPRHAETKPKADSSELTSRISAANAARESGDLAVVALANQRLIAAGLREVAELRMVESAYPQAVDLYRRSLEYEDSAEIRTDLAFAELRAGRFDEAIAQAEKARKDYPSVSSSQGTRIDQVLAHAFMEKADYAHAAESFLRLTASQPDIPTLYSLSICLLGTRKPEDKQHAAEIFGQMHKMAGDSGSLHVLFGRAYRDAEDMPAAIREFQRAIEIDPTTPHAHYFLGLARLSLNEWKPTAEAESEMKSEIHNYPRDYLANYMLGFLLSAERRYQESDRYMEAAADINPTAPEPPLYMGLNAYAQDDAKRAEEMLRKAIILTGNDDARSNYQIRRAYVDLGRILSTSGRKGEAEAFLTKARELQNKTMEQSQQSIASMAMAGGGGMAAAIVPLSSRQENEAAPALQPGAEFARPDAASLANTRLTPAQRDAVDTRENDLRSVLGLAFSDLATSEALRRNYAAALSHYQQAEQWDASVPALDKNLGQSAFRSGDYAEAIRGLSKALLSAPDSAPLRAMLGMSYFATDKYADAAKTFAPLGVSGMTDGETGYAWAASLAHLGDMKKAADVLNEFQSSPRPNDVLLLAGQLWTEIGDYSRAIATFSQVLQSNPSQPRAHFDAGLAYIRWEHWPEAAQEFQKELALYPGSPDPQYHLGFVYLQQAKVAEAADLFQQVVTNHPDYANAQYELGKILLDRGQTADAVTHLELAAHLSPQADYLHYQLQAAYRKQGRTAEANRELDIYKELKAKSRERAAQATKQNH